MEEECGSENESGCVIWVNRPALKFDAVKGNFTEDPDNLFSKGCRSTDVLGFHQEFRHLRKSDEGGYFDMLLFNRRRRKKTKCGSLPKISMKNFG